jgi:Leucine-rich repeat (LRR) protein
LRNLESLDFSYNKLKELGKDTFNGLVCLDKLNLSNNQIEVIDDEAFIGTCLGILNLSCNRIRNISENSFKGLSRVYELNVSNNELEEDKLKLATKNLANLILLYFSNNDQFDWRPRLKND